MTYSHYLMESFPIMVEPLITDLSTLWQHTAVTLATLSMETVSEFVRIAEHGVGQLQHVKVRTIIAHS